jgi:hypothetical protein
MALAGTKKSLIAQGKYVIISCVLFCALVG